LRSRGRKFFVFYATYPYTLLGFVVGVFQCLGVLFVWVLAMLL
jgi:hypothetical protein